MFLSPPPLGAPKSGRRGSSRSRADRRHSSPPMQFRYDDPAPSSCSAIVGSTEAAESSERMEVVEKVEPAVVMAADERTSQCPTKAASRAWPPAKTLPN